MREMLNNLLSEGIQTVEWNLQDSVVILLFALLLGIYLFVVYRLFVRKTLYNHNLNITLVGLTLITTAIMLTIQSNLVLSLGMVGALSIVRYRTAVKDPMDLFFLFWAIACGIMCGAGQFELALVVTFILTITVFVLGQLPSLKAPYILVINGKREGLESTVTAVLKKYHRNFKIKSRNIVDDTERLIIELKVSKERELLEELTALEGVNKVSLLTYEGDVI